MTAYEIVATVFGALGLIAGAIGYFRAKSAGAAADKAQRDATSALTRSAAAAEEAAAALHRANELAEAQLPKPEVTWSLRRETESGYRLVNTGELVANNARIEGNEGILTDEDSRRDAVVPGDSLEFHRLRAMGLPSPRITVHWEDPDGTERNTSAAVPR